MKIEPKIVLLETNQIIPDKNLFGQSNFATNTFDVLIQLRKISKKRSRSHSHSRSRSSRLARQATKDEEMIKNELNNNAIAVNNDDNDANDNIPINYDVKDVPIPVVNYVMTKSDRLETNYVDDTDNDTDDDTKDDSIPDVTNQDKHGELDDNKYVTSSKFDTKIGDTSHVLCRKSTNMMKEGHEDNHHSE